MILVVDVGFVVTVAVVNGVVVVVVVDETAGFQILNVQNVGSYIGADSGPQNSVPLATPDSKKEEVK